MHRYLQALWSMGARKLQLLCFPIWSRAVTIECWWLGRSEPCHHVCVSAGVYSRSSNLLACTPRGWCVRCANFLRGFQTSACPRHFYTAVDNKLYYRYYSAVLLAIMVYSITSDFFLSHFWRVQCKHFWLRLLTFSWVLAHQKILNFCWWLSSSNFHKIA